MAEIDENGRILTMKNPGRRNFSAAVVGIALMVVAALLPNAGMADPTAQTPRDDRPRAAILPGDPREQLDVAYCRAGVNNRPLHMDIYQPPRPVEGPDGPYPAVLVFHGGSFIGGDKAIMRSVALDFARRGFVAASVQYRLAPYRYPDMIADAKSAVRFLRTEAATYRVDSNNIGAIGHSAGGTLALMLAVTPDFPLADGTLPSVSARINTAVSLAGLADFERDAPRILDRMRFGMEFFLGEWGVEKSSPARLVTAGDAPMMMVHGRGDSTVPFSHSEMMVQACERAGVESKLIADDQMEHNFIFASRHYSRVMPDVFDWMQRHLRTPSAGGAPPAADSRPTSPDAEQDF